MAMTYDEYVELMFSNNVNKLIKDLDSGMDILKVSQIHGKSVRIVKCWKANTIMCYQQYLCYHAMGLED